MVSFRYEDIDFQLYEDDYEGLLDEEDEGRDAQEKVDDELVKVGRIQIKEPTFDMNQFDADIQARFEYMKKNLVCDEKDKEESEDILLELTKNMLVIWQHEAFKSFIESTNKIFQGMIYDKAFAFHFF